MGNTKKTDKKKKDKRKALKKDRKALLKSVKAKGLKTECCKKYEKKESKRCGRCPCFDLLRKVA